MADNVGPWSADILTRVVNVHWGEGVFAAGNETDAPVSDITLTTMRGEQSSWQTATIFSADRHRYNVRAGIYGKPGEGKEEDGKTATPTFCLGGLDTDHTVSSSPGFMWRSFIVTSTDGARTWTKTHFSEHGFVEAMAYDKSKQKFYAQVTDDTKGDTGTGEIDYDIVTLESSDGMSWQTVLTATGSPEYFSPLVLAACDDTYQDASGHNCPGGVYGYDKNNKTMIAPYPDINPWMFEGRFSGDKIKIRREDKDGKITTEIKSIPGMASVSSVTFAGGVWQACGNDGDKPSGVIASSSDDGNTWKIVYQHATSSNVAIVLGTA